MTLSCTMYERSFDFFSDLTRKAPRKRNVYIIYWAYKSVKIHPDKWSNFSDDRTHRVAASGKLRQVLEANIHIKNEEFTLFQNSLTQYLKSCIFQNSFDAFQHRSLKEISSSYKAVYHLLRKSLSLYRKPCTIGITIALIKTEQGTSPTDTLRLSSYFAQR